MTAGRLLTTKSSLCARRRAGESRTWPTSASTLTERTTHRGYGPKGAADVASEGTSTERPTVFIQVMQGKCTARTSCERCRRSGPSRAVRRRRLARRHLRVHRRRHLLRRGPVRRTARPRWPTPHVPRERVGGADGGALRRARGVPRLRRRHAALQRRSDEARFVQIIRGKVDDVGPAPRGHDVRPGRAPRDAPRHPGRDPGHRGGRHLHRDGGVHRRGERPQLARGSRLRRRSLPSSSTPCRARSSTTCGTPGSRAPAEPDREDVDPPDALGRVSPPGLNTLRHLLGVRTPV